MNARKQRENKHGVDLRTGKQKKESKRHPTTGEFDARHGQVGTKGF